MDIKTKDYPEEIDVQKYWLVLRRRWLVASGVLVTSVALAGLAASRQQPAYEVAGKLLVESNRTTSLTGVGEKIAELESLKREDNPLDTQAVIVQSLPILQQVIDTLKLKDEEGVPLDPKLLEIKVDPIIGTDVLQISYAHKDPKLAASVVNQVMKSYIQNNIFTNRAEALAAGKFVKEQLPRAQAELNSAAEALRRFKSQNQIIELEKEAGAAVTTITTLNDQLNQARADLADVVAQETEVRRQVGLSEQEAVNVTSLNQIPGVQEVLTELQKVQTQLATEGARYTAAHPAITDLQQQEAALNSLLQERIAVAVGANQQVSAGELQIGDLRQKLAADFVQLQVQRLGLERKINALSSLQASHRQRANILPNLEKKQGELERRLLVAQKSYENLLTRLQEIQVAEIQTVGNARVIESALVPTKPAGSKKKLLLAAGGFAGLLLGVAGAFFVDLIDRSLKTVKESQALFGYTLLGLIPKFETNDPSNQQKVMLEGASPRVIVATSPRSVIHEAYQMLQANLKFISHKKVRTIVVTSSVPQEGKSEVSANLAAVLAQAGRRVLLVDADMRHPSQHHLWGVMNLTGLSNIIVGQDEFPQAVQTVTSNLSILTAGVMPPNPLALIDSESMSALIDQFAENYDYIVFDTPPLAGTADAAVLGKMADGVVVVVRPGVADSASATAAKTLLARSEANVLGIVANGVNLKHEPDSYFYYTNPRFEQYVEKADPVSVPQTVTSDQRLG